MAAGVNVEPVVAGGEGVFTYYVFRPRDIQKLLQYNSYESSYYHITA